MQRKKTRKFKGAVPLARAVSVVSAVIIVVGGVTFAFLQSQRAEVTGNTIQTSTANLLVGLNSTEFGPTKNGFSFAGLVPGGAAIPAAGHTIYLKNAGGVPLALGLAVSSVPDNPNNVDLNKVNIVLTPTSGTPQEFNLQSLVSSSSSMGMMVLPTALLAPNAVTQYKIQVSMAADAVTTPSASLSNITFSFSGTALPVAT